MTRKLTDKEALKNAVLAAAIEMSNKAYMAGWEMKAEKVCRAVDRYMKAIRAQRKEASK